MTLRPAEVADQAAVRQVVSAAFGHSDSAEAIIVDKVRSSGAALIELVAEEAGAVIGYVLFSRLICAPQKLLAGLGPLAVHPDHQGRRVGAALSLEGLEVCRQVGVEAAVVLGHPGYYPRFGFSSAAAAAIRSRYSGSPAFMAIELVQGALRAPIDITYPPAFS